MISRYCPIINKKVFDFFLSKQFTKFFKSSPTHFLFLDLINDNFKKINQFFAENKIDYQIFYSQKANRSQQILRKIKNLGKIGVECSSQEELRMALNENFLGDEIICQGPKNEKYLKESIKAGSIIAVNSINELKKLIQSKKRLKIFIRLGQLKISGYEDQLTRFGIDEKDLNEAINLIKKSQIHLIGFSFHLDTTNDDLKREYLKKALNIAITLIKNGVFLEAINIGGGWRPQYVSKETWIKFNQNIAELILEKQFKYLWKDYSFGYRLKNNRLIGEGNFFPYFSEEIDNQLKKIFDFEIFKDNAMHIIRDLNIKIFLESGRYLLNQVGHTLASVIEVGQKLNFNYLIADLKATDISSQIDIIYDPILIKKDKMINKEKFIGFIFGNTCLEDDLIFKRQIVLNKKPKEGDYLLFVNTGAYKMGISETPFISLKIPERIFIEDDLS